MINILPRLKREFPWLNKRSVTQEDLLRFCYNRGVEVVFTPEVTDGIWVRCDGADHIFLNNKLRGWRLLYVFSHEVAHCIFHGPSQSRACVEFFSLHSDRKNHFEAEASAALLLLPIADLEPAVNDGIHKNSSEIAELISLRIELHKNYKI